MVSVKKTSNILKGNIKEQNLKVCFTVLGIVSNKEGNGSFGELIT